MMEGKTKTEDGCLEQPPPGLLTFSGQSLSPERSVSTNLCALIE